MADVGAVLRFRHQLHEMGRLMWLSVQLAWRASPRLALGILLLLLVQALLPSLNLVLYRLVLDRAALGLGHGTIHDPLAAHLSLLTWIACAAVGVVLAQLLQLVAATFQTMAGDRLTAYVTEQVIRAANRWPGLARFEDPTFADDLHRTRTAASRGGLSIMVHGATGVMHLVTVVGASLVLLHLHPFVPALLLLASLPAMARQWEYVCRVGMHLYDQTPEARRLAYYRAMLLSVEPAKDVRLYGLGAFFRQRYEGLFAATMHALDELRRGLIRGVALAGALSAAAMGVVYVYTVWLAAQGHLSVGDVVLYGGAVTLLQAELGALARAAGYLPQELRFLPGLFRVLEAPPDLPQAQMPCPAPRPIRWGIVFEHIGFTYPGHATPVLQDVSFCIRPGECMALVGHNGAGKTTIVKLLLRLYDPTTGRILLDGVDLQEYDVEDLRREMGVIFQDFVRYELTAGENIAMGQVEALGDRARLLAAAARGGARDLVEHLPQGLDTPLGRELGDHDLSGGEWQKLALARAFVRDCQVLVLDEPTAALDVQTEYDMYTRFHHLTRGRMTLLISHRFSTVRGADRILYLADGRIQEEGSHAELRARGGAYAHLYTLQASQYLDEDRAEGQA